MGKRNRKYLRKFARGLRVESLESRRLLAAEIGGGQPVFPDGLGYTDPDVRAAIMAVTTTNSQEPMYSYRTSGSGGGGDINPFTNQSGDLIGMNLFRTDPRFTQFDGAGFAAVVLDTGIDLNHPFFGPDGNGDGVADRIVYHYDFANGDADASDFDGHGSNVTSIVGSSDSVHTGMAPGADLIHLKVFTDAGGGNFGYLESALQWVIANAATYNIASINMSLGDSGNYASAGARYGLGDELAALVALDVIVVSAQGNSFFEFGSAQGASYPASDPNSMSVGAVYDANIGPVGYGGAQANSTGPGRITPFSQRSTTLTDIMAPGAAITGANFNGGTVSQHGTSQAAPHIAGIAVLVQDMAQHYLGRRFTQAEFIDLLQQSATTINDGDDEDDNVVNTGANFPLVDVFDLAELIFNSVAPPAAVATADDIFTVPEDPQIISVTYTDNSGIDVSLLGTGDIVVTGPNGFSANATFISVDNNADGTPRFATYQLDAPGGTWGTEDNGNYVISLAANQVADVDGNFIPAGSIGSFVVNLTTDLGPDGGGYYAAAMVYAFDDIRLTGTRVLNSTDDNAILLEPGNGFMFEFYGQQWDSLYVSSNGLITFGEPESGYLNTSLEENPSVPAIAVLWDDLIAAASQGVYWQLKGSGDQQRLVLQWETSYFGSTAGISFQAILSEADSSIVVSYRDLDGNSSQHNGGASATVGIKDAGSQGANRLLVSLNEAANNYVGTGRALRFEQRNQAPVEVGLATQGIFENLPADSHVGDFWTVDPDVVDSHTYELVAGTGDEDNDLFYIDGTSLMSTQSFDFEDRSSYSIRVRSTDSQGLLTEQTFTIEVLDLPEVNSIVVGDGSEQRSNVKQVVVTFDGEVTIDEGAFEVVKRGDAGGTIATNVATSLDSEGRTVATITFAGPFTRGTSLVDGSYQLMIHADLIHRGLNALDGDVNGTAGGDRSFGTTAADKFYAFFGDVNGDGAVSLPEFNMMRSTFGRSEGQAGYNELFDFDGNGSIGLADFNQFRSRFGRTFTWE